MGIVNRWYLKKKGCKCQQNEGKENYWGSANLTAKEETTPYSVLLGALEKCYD